MRNRLSDFLNSLDSSLKHAWFQAVEELLAGSREIDVDGNIDVTNNAPLTNVAHVTLPGLPAGGSWYIGGASTLFIKAPTVGSAGTTTVTASYMGTTIATWTLAGGVDTNATFKAADSAVVLALPPDAEVYFSVTGKATGLVGPLTVRTKFIPQTQRDDLFHA